MCAMTYSRI